MKTYVNLNLVMLSLIIGFSSCSKEEVVGPQGPQGPQGIQGNANVKTTQFINQTFFYNPLAKVYQVNIDEPNITSSILSKGSVNEFYCRGK